MNVKYCTTDLYSLFTYLLVHSSRYSFHPNIHKYIHTYTYINIYIYIHVIEHVSYIFVDCYYYCYYSSLHFAPHFFFSSSSLHCSLRFSPTFLFLRQGAARRDARKAVIGGIVSGIFAFVVYFLAGDYAQTDYSNDEPFWIIFSYNIFMMAAYLFILTSSHWLPRRPAMFYYAIFR